MKVIRSIPQLRYWIERVRHAGKAIGFVPTMGALHAGHVSLIHRARDMVGEKGVVVVSVFVNPTQFDRKTDLKKYPRRFRKDVSICRRAGADLIFVPRAGDMYPRDFSTRVEESRLSLPLCGSRRPDHFRGVCTIVLKLFNLVQPSLAVFGQKDAQQAAVIQRMVWDLNVPVRVVIVSTVREKDGLAMSSRNQHLSPVERRRATVIHEALELVRQTFRKGNRSTITLKSLARRHLLGTSGLRLDSLEFVNASTLQPISSRCSRGDLLAVAVFFGRTRLIDNMRL